MATKFGVGMMALAMTGLIVGCAAEPEEEEVSEDSAELTSTQTARYLEVGIACVPNKCGDINGDGRVTVTDGVLASRIAAGLIDAKPGSCAFLAADVDSNGRVTVTDAVNIQRFAAGLPANIKCLGGLVKIPQL